MHASHNGQILQTAIDHMIQKCHMRGQILHVCLRIMHKAIAPCHMHKHVRAAALLIDIFLPVKDLHVNPLCPLVNSLVRKIGHIYIMPCVAECLDHMMTNISCCSGNQYLHRITPFISPLYNVIQRQLLLRSLTPVPYADKHSSVRRTDGSEAAGSGRHTDRSYMKNVLQRQVCCHTVSP